MSENTEPPAGIDIERRSGILLIHLDRPARRNALDARTMYALGATLLDAASDASVKAIVIAGRGPVFCAGADLAAYGASMSTPDGPNEMNTAARAGASAPKPGLGVLIREAFPKPVICAVQGPALGLGFEIVLASDIVVASNRATFGLPEVKYGLVPSGGGAARLVKRFPTSLALWMLLSGEAVDAERALRHGLINELVNDSRAPLDVALDMAATIGGHPAAALLATKALALRSIALFDDEVQQMGDDLLDGVLNSSETTRRVMAFGREPEVVAAGSAAASRAESEST